MIITVILLLGCGSWFAFNGVSLLFNHSGDASTIRGFFYMFLGIIMLIAGGIQAKQSYINMCGGWA
ncbi:hypothetical protein [Delftia phage PhiW-14]|uniref:Uncharacterized protein n=1 Tax=Delftia phage PhiW-14 TaxID=665032 RepID=C9DGE2_BPW14|nr:hypothetical protein DP-phiW-14_gp172 [Delftia phage PhiW-14]ACV50193.1 hypothetical protein [Delftia phage PhiW-14]